LNKPKDKVYGFSTWATTGYIKKLICLPYCKGDWETFLDSPGVLDGPGESFIIPFSCRTIRYILHKLLGLLKFPAL
jgi:hypothetical protein